MLAMATPAGVVKIIITKLKREEKLLSLSQSCPGKASNNRCFKVNATF